MRDDIERCAGPDTEIIEGPELRSTITVARLAAAQADIGVSAFFGYILRKEVIDLFPRGIVNIHSGLLPYNRGAHPNIWSIVDRTPPGATIHYVDEGIDTGDVIAQCPIEADPADTGATLYRRLESACVKLFQETWPAITAGTASRVPQDPRAGTSHRQRDVAAIDSIDLDAPTTARALLDRIRARTFPPHDGSYFVENGRKVHLRLELYTTERHEDSE